MINKCAFAMIFLVRVGCFTEVIERSKINKMRGYGTTFTSLCACLSNCKGGV